jgi:hypothetical protein
VESNGGIKMSNIVTIDVKMTNRLNRLIAYAISHGFKAIMKRGKVLVFDKDGGVLTDNFSEVREFLGY